jgi:serine protease
MPRLRVAVAPISIVSLASAVASCALALFGASTAAAAPPSGKPLGKSVIDLPGEIVVDFKDDTSKEDIAKLGADLGVTFRDNSVLADDDKIELASVSPSDESSLLARLAGDPRVEHAEPLRVVRASFVPDDPMYKDQWHLTRVGSETAWEYACGLGVSVAVIDTGVACYDAPPFSKGSDLAGTRCEGGYNFIDDDTSAYDDHGHGTHVAGTVAQTTNNGKGVAGLAFCARVMPVKVLNGYGWGNTADVAEGIRWAADHGAQVINLSLGSPSSSDLMKDAVKHALDKGVVVVAAAGNEGEEDSVGYPAAYPGVIAVSATDSSDELAWFSSRGPQVAIAAPGVKVTQQTVCDGGQNACEIFGVFSGTSMASPHVAGAAAMLVGLGVSDPPAVRAILQQTALAKGKPTDYGAGIMDAAAAAKQVWYRHLFLRLALLGAIAFVVGRRIKNLGGTMAKTRGMIFGALLAGVGILPIAPLLHLAARAGKLRPFVELLARPFGEWDLVFSAGVHRWLPLANALPALLLTGLFFGSKKLRPFVGGFALGTSAFLAQLAWSAEVATPFGMTAVRIFLVVNVLVALWIARLSLDRKET